MKKIVGVFILSVFFLFWGGCRSTALNKFRDENRQNLTKLKIGMLKQEVMEIMGDRRANDQSLMGMYFGAPVTSVTNPYKIEILQGKEKTFEVLYYYTDVKKEDSAITDDELTPLVFDNGKLIGWGSSFLEQNVQKYEIRFR